MSITSALYTGVSGLTSNGEAMNVIGNNISNVNTVGFKSARTLFSDMLSANMGNNSQVGRGSQIQKVDNVFSQGSMETTENITDLTIQGNSFFALGKPGGNTQVAAQNNAFLTRAGAFRTDSNNYLVNPDGYQVLDTSGNPIKFNDNAAAITTAATTYATSATTSATDATAAAANATANATAAKTAADAAKTAADATLVAANAMPSTTPAEVTARNNAITLANAAIAAAIDAVNSGTTATSDASSLTAAASALTSGAALVAGNPSADNGANANRANAAVAVSLAPALASGNALQGKLNAVAAALSLVAAALPAGAAATAASTASANATTAATAAGTAAATAATSNATATASNSAATTAYTPVENAAGLAFAKVLKIDPNGLITYLGKDGVTQLYYNSNSTVGVPSTTANAALVQRIALVNATDPGSLEKIGGTLFRANAASGVPSTGFSAATSSTEKIFTNSLEMSNVDMAAQFVKMIVTQRAYSANSKTITTTDEMTQEALNLKR
jgi:flagellar hook protein FlgE